MQSKNIAIGVVIVLGLLLGSYLIFSVGLPDRGLIPSINNNEEVTTSGEETYSSEELGVSFSYPDNYKVTENTINEAQRLHKAIVLTDASTVIPVNGEGPTAITIDVFQNNLDNLSALDFIKNTNSSNYKLGNGELEEGSLDGRVAYRYTWDGLYRGESIVTATPEYIYMFSVTYLEDSDPIRGDFYTVVNSATLTQ